MRTPPAALALVVAVAGCATGRVALLPGEGDAPAGAVAVLDPRTGAEVGQLNRANTQASLGGGAVRPQALKQSYEALLATMPAAPRTFTLYFVEGTTTLTEASKPVLAELREIVTPASDVQITGHTDTVGDAASNDKLSLDRAIEIRSALVRAGLPVANARTAGRGERELRVPTGDRISEPANRRVEVILR